MQIQASPGTINVKNICAESSLLRDESRYLPFTSPQPYQLTRGYFTPFQRFYQERFNAIFLNAIEGKQVVLLIQDPTLINTMIRGSAMSPSTHNTAPWSYKTPTTRCKDCCLLFWERRNRRRTTRTLQNTTGHPCALFCPICQEESPWGSDEGWMSTNGLNVIQPDWHWPNINWTGRLISALFSSQIRAGSQSACVTYINDFFSFHSSLSTNGLGTQW